MSALESIIGSMSLAELARLANTTVEQIVAAAMSPSSMRADGGSGMSPRTSPQAEAGKLPRGSVRLDLLLSVVAGAKGPIDISAIRTKVSGSPAQVRAALRKLESAGQVRISGERRATRYTAV